MIGMVRLAIRNLLQEKTSLAVSLGGVALALFLILLLEGIFEGTSKHVVAYLEESDADVWVMQEGVSNMHMATSVVPAGLEDAIERVPGVTDAVPILYASMPIMTGNRKWFSYVVGIRHNSERGGPWAMAEGSPNPGPGEVVVSDVVAREGGIGQGQELEILGRSLRVVGLSRDTFSMANTVTFISYGDMENILGAPGAAAYFLVKGKDGIDPAALAERVRSSLPGVNVLTREEFVASDRTMARQMGVEVIQVMSLIGFVVGVLVIGLTMYTATVRRSREYGVAKAIGATNWQLVAAVGLQAVALALAGLALAIAFAYLVRPLVNAAMPLVPLAYPAKSLIKLAVIAPAIAVAASLMPAHRVARLDPLVVFKE